MNRELKFRQWLGNRFEYWGIGVDECTFKGPASGGRARPDHTPHGQYTGLRDKTDKEIYEGDIVMARTNTSPVYGLFGVVVFKDGEYMIEQEGRTFPACSFAVVDRRTVEVLGNIHEHPSLLVRPTMLNANKGES